MLKDIVERSTSNSAAAPSQPVAPSLPTRGTGFPVAVHRSHRGPSAFARTRQQEAARQSGQAQNQRALGEGRAVDAIPTLTVSGPSALPSPSSASASSSRQDEDKTPLSEAEQVRRAVEADNLQRVEAMSQAEREEEISELQERFGSNIISFMKKRQQARLSPSTAPTLTEPNHTEAGPSHRATVSVSFSSRSVEQALGDAESILRDVDEENSRRVEGMNGLERQQEVEELQERFGVNLLAALRKRAESRGPEGKGKEKQREDEGSAETPSVRSAPVASSSSSSVAVHPSAAPPIHSHPEDPSLSELKAYFPSVPSETSKLAWLQPLVTAPTASKSQSTATRFDLSGNVLSSTAQADLPSHLGLHHHGTSPDLAGYTISDILYLSRSTVPSQRITMMGVLSKIIVKLRDGQSTSQEAKRELEVAEARKRAVEMGIEVLAGLTRGVGVIEAGIELLYEALAGPTWDSWLDEDSGIGGLSPARPFVLDEDKEVGIASIPFEDVLPRVTELLSLEDGISPRTAHQLISILRRATYISSELCEMICPAIPTVIKQHVVQRPWPPKIMSTAQSRSGSGTRYPSVDALRLLRDLTTSSRACAEELLGQGVYETTLRFVVTATWESEDTDPSIIYHGQALACVVMDTSAVLGQYGLSASIATSSSEIWRLLGAWVQRQGQPGERAAGTRAFSRRLIRAYYKCLGVWITCAVDPHRTTPEHDLTWAQVDAMKWQEEATSFIKHIMPPIQGGRGDEVKAVVEVREITAAVDMLNLWARGIAVNGVKNGEQEKMAVLEGLREGRLSEFIAGMLSQGDGETDREEREELLAACVQLHDHLEPAGELMNRDTLDIVSRRYLAGPFSSESRRAITYIRYYLVQLAIRASSHTSTGSTSPSIQTTTAMPWLSSAFSLFRSFTIGDEPLALDLLDALLKVDYKPLLKIFTSLSLSHSDGLQLLRPLLQYAILPNVEHIVAPCQPSHLYLKATSTLRGSPPRTSDEKPALPGLPLQPDWMFSPLNELLRSGTSDALAQVPPDWQASEVEIVQASLILAVLAYGLPPSSSPSSTGSKDAGPGSIERPSGGFVGAALNPCLDDQDRSRILLNLMKVHMLEHGQTTSNTANEVEVFRDPLVGDLMKEMMAWLTTLPSPQSQEIGPPDVRKADSKAKSDCSDEDDNSAPVGAEPDTSPTATATAPAPLEQVAIPFLGTGVPFYQFYADFVALYEAISFSDPLFSQLLIAPLSMDYPADYRRLIWNDHSSVLRGIGLKYMYAAGPTEDSASASVSNTNGDRQNRINQLPIENSSKGINAYFEPLETDNQVLAAYARALTQGLITEQRNPFLYDVAVHHLCGLFWDERGEEARDSIRVGLLITVLAGGPDALIRMMLEWHWPSIKEGQVQQEVEDSKQRRKAVVAKLAGPRGTKRVEGL
ncbi:hypothetical protein IAU59_000077 [Kwoniella sp. CBS 9459]